MKKKLKKLRESEVLEQVNRLRSLPAGKAGPEEINERIAAIKKFMLSDARDRQELEEIIDRCIRTLEWIPVPKEVHHIMGAMRQEKAPFWEPPKREQRTRQDVLEDLAFQRQFAIDKPKLAGAAAERIAELELELRSFEEAA